MDSGRPECFHAPRPGTPFVNLFRTALADEAGPVPDGLVNGDARA